MWQVLDKGDCGLAVSHNEDGISSVRERATDYLNAPNHEYNDVVCDEEDDPKLTDAALLSTIVYEDLGELNRCKSEGM